MMFGDPTPPPFLEDEARSTIADQVGTPVLCCPGFGDQLATAAKASDQSSPLRSILGFC